MDADSDTLPQSPPNIESVNAGLTSLFRGGDGVNALKLLAACMTEQKHELSVSCVSPVSPPTRANANSEEATIQRLADDDCSEAHIRLLALDVTTFALEQVQLAYGTMLASHARSGQAKLALEVLNTMASRGIERTTLCYRFAIEACAHASEWAHCLQLLSRARAEQNASARADCDCYRAALSALRSVRQWQHAVALVEAAHADGLRLDAACYDSAIGSLLGAPRAWQSALALYNRMENTSVELTPAVCTSLSEIFAECGQYQQAVQFLETFHERGIPPEPPAYAASIRACEKAASWFTILSLLKAFEERSPHVFPSVAMIAPAIRALAEATQLSEALALLPKLHDALAASAAAVVTSGNSSAAVDSTATVAAETAEAEAYGALRSLYRAARYSGDDVAEMAVIQSFETCELAPVATVRDAGGQFHRYVALRDLAGPDARQAQLDMSTAELTMLLCGCTSIDDPRTVEGGPAWHASQTNTALGLGRKAAAWHVVTRAVADWQVA